MTRDNLCRLEIELFNATRKFANRKNKENKKQIFFAKMEDEPRNGTNSTIFKLDSLGNANINGYARVIYMYNSYNERDWKVKIDGHKIHDRRTGEPVYHKIVEEYKEALIREIPDIKSRIMEEDQVNNHSNNYYSRSL